MITNLYRANGSSNSVDGDKKIRSRLISTMKLMRHRLRRIVNCDSLNQISVIIEERHLKVSPTCFSPRSRGCTLPEMVASDPFSMTMGFRTSRMSLAGRSALGSGSAWTSRIIVNKSKRHFKGRTSVDALPTAAAALRLKA
jgi:hypothetical protein